MQAGECGGQPVCITGCCQGDYSDRRHQAFVKGDSKAVAQPTERCKDQNEIKPGSQKENAKARFVADAHTGRHPDNWLELKRNNIEPLDASQTFKAV